MSLGDSFPAKFKDEFAQRTAKIGSVIKITDTNAKPKPKEKRFIVIAETADSIALGALYINTEINVNVFKTDKLKKLQVRFLAAGRQYLEWDSWVDCSKIKSFPKKDIAEYLKKSPEKHLGNISDTDLKTLLSAVKSAFTIDLTQRKKWGLI